MMYVAENFNNWSRSSARHLLHFGPKSGTLATHKHGYILRKFCRFKKAFFFFFFPPFSLVMAYKCSFAGWLGHGRKKNHLVNVNSLCKWKIMHPRAHLVYASGGSMRHSPWCRSRTHSLQCISVTLHCCIGAQLECACSIYCTKESSHAGHAFCK